MENLLQENNVANTLTIPKSDFEDLIENDSNILNFTEIRNSDWSYLLKLDGEVPKYLGLIAIQCHAAFFMRNEGRVNAGNFRDRFIEITGIESTQKLNQLFSECCNNGLNIQETIWIHAQKFFRSNKIIVEIPTLKKYAGRNTQYPESQCILNYEDLKEYCSFYEYIHGNFETIHYDEFISEYERYRRTLTFYRENNLRKYSANQEKTKRRQLFDHYNSQDWMRTDDPRTIKLFSSTDYLASVSDSIVTIFDEDYEVFENYLSLLDKNKLAFFKQDEKYSREYNSCKKIEPNANYIILTSSRDLKTQLSKLIIKEISFSKGDGRVYPLLIRITNNIPKALIQYQTHEFPIKIVGKRISRKRQYLISNPPKLVAENGTKFRLFRNRKLVKNNQVTAEGLYHIKTSGFSPIYFEVVGNKRIEEIITEFENKIDLNTLEYHTNGHMQGLEIVSTGGAVESKAGINNWIRILTARPFNPEKFHHKNIIISALNKHKYGRNN